MNISKFQIIVLVVFVLFLVGGVIAFATYKGGGSSNTLPTVTIWGTFPEDVFDQYIGSINNAAAESLSIRYVQVSPASFSSQFISALARGAGPDVILVTADSILPHHDKLAPIPFSALPQRTFTDTYIQEANTYISSNGIYALPFVVDPLVMYWNRDMFDAAGVATYPTTWDQFTGLNKKLTSKDQNGYVRKSAIALGLFGNVNNAREILGTLFLQSGNPVTGISSSGEIQTTIKLGYPADPQNVVTFFTKFVNPNNPDYSWNRSLPTAKSAFLAGSLATYFGFASELLDIKEKNPNLNYDVALMPQIKNGVRATYGRMYGFSIVRSSPNINAAYQVISQLTSSQYIPYISSKLYLPSVRRNVIDQGSTDPNITIFNQSALISRTWIDVDPNRSAQIMSDMIESYTSGQKTLTEAIQDAGDQYDLVLKQATQ